MDLWIFESMDGKSTQFDRDNNQWFSKCLNHHYIIIIIIIVQCSVFSDYKNKCQRKQSHSKAEEEQQKKCKKSDSHRVHGAE